MKISHKNKRTNYTVAVAAIVVLVVSASLLAWKSGYLDIGSEGTPKTTEVTDDNKPQDGHSQELKSDQAGKTSQSDLPDKQPTSNTPVQTADEDLVIDTSISTPSIERIGQSGNYVKIVAGFSASQPGICEVTFSRDGNQPLSYRSQITVSPHNYSCSFVIPATDFPSSGSWRSGLVQRVGNRSSPTSTQTIEVVR